MFSYTASLVFLSFSPSRKEKKRQKEELKRAELREEKEAAFACKDVSRLPGLPSR